jgi:hypothetical protein
MKPLMEYGKSSDSFPEAAPSGRKKTHFRAEVGLDVRLEFSLGVRFHHFLGDSRNRVDSDLVHYASPMSSPADE